MRWNDVQMMMWGWGDRAWWVIESVFLRSIDKGFWACLGDLPLDMPRRPETRVSLCNLTLKLRGISRSSAILGSDSPQSNNRKDNSLCSRQGMAWHGMAWHSIHIRTSVNGIAELGMIWNMLIQPYYNVGKRTKRWASIETALSWCSLHNTLIQ